MDISSKPIALVSMPVLAADIPSFQLALLKPALERAGIRAQPFSLYMYFGAHIGWRLNDAFSAVRPCVAGEWIWSRAAFGDFAVEEDYLAAYQRNLQAVCQEAGCTLEDIRRVRDRESFSFLEFCLDSIDWRRFGLIGFSVVFQQMLASLALARRLKERFPAIPIVLGGAAFEDDIAEAIMSGCPYVDFIHCGDAEETFPQMIGRLYRGESMEGLRGLMWRERETIHYQGRAPNLPDMDSTPIPDFDEYYYARRESGYERSPGAKPALLPIETARGCWWGMRNHCTFCGLNRAGIEFRAKSVQCVLEMVKTLSQRYGVFGFDAIDNIMASEYVEQLFGRLAEERSDLRFHYEVRPSLSRAQLGRMRAGGLVSVQPGIESFSTHVLRLMNKHITGMRNVTFVKWCTYYGIDDLYNILYGFPGEILEDYQMQCQVIARIPHLQPPWAIAQARPDRGSPMFTAPESFGLRSLRPSYCYHHIYPPDRFDLCQVSYYFEHDYVPVVVQHNYAELFARVAEWQQRWKRAPLPSLRYRKSVETILIEDRRSGERRDFVYADREAELYEFCDDARSLQAICEHLDDDGGWIRATLTDWIEKDLVLHLDERYLSLALPANPYC